MPWARTNDLVAETNRRSVSRTPCSDFSGKPSAYAACVCRCPFTTIVIELITKAPQSDLWRLTGDGEIRFIRPETDWHAVGGEDEAFYLQVYGAGDYCYPGADQAIEPPDQTYTKWF